MQQNFENMNIIKIILIVFIVKNNNCFTYFIINQSITSCRSLHYFLHQINQIYQKKLLSSHHMLLLVFCILTFFLSCSWIIILILNRINQHNWKTYIFNISFMVFYYNENCAFASVVFCFSI